MKRIIALITVFVMLLSVNAFALNGESPWATEMTAKAEAYSIVPDSLLNESIALPITKGEAAGIAVKLYETLAGKTVNAGENPFDENVSDDVLKASNTGLCPFANGGVFNENSYATREEIATMYAKAYVLATGKGLGIANKVEFADDAVISDWAKESCYFVEANGIIHIVGSNKFAPKNTTEDETRANYANMTREVALIAAVRLYEMVNGSSDVGPGEETEKDNTVGKACLSKMPLIDFGTIIKTEVDKETATVIGRNATTENYNDYVNKIKNSFSGLVYELAGQNYVASDGQYTISVVFSPSSGDFTVTVFVNE